MNVVTQAMIGITAMHFKVLGAPTAFNAVNPLALADFETNLAAGKRLFYTRWREHTNWDAGWAARCRTKIKGCDGVIILLSKNSYYSSGLRYEAKCARTDGIPILGVHIHKYDQGAPLPELYRKKKVIWSWENIYDFIEDL